MDFTGTPTTALKVPDSHLFEVRYNVGDNCWTTLVKASSADEAIRAACSCDHVIAGVVIGDAIEDGR